MGGLGYFIGHAAPRPWARGWPLPVLTSQKGPNSPNMAAVHSNKDWHVCKSLGPNMATILPKVTTPDLMNESVPVNTAVSYLKLPS